MKSAISADSCLLIELPERNRPPSAANACPLYAYRQRARCDGRCAGSACGASSLARASRGFFSSEASITAKALVLASLTHSSGEVMDPDPNKNSVGGPCYISADTHAPDRLVSSATATAWLPGGPPNDHGDFARIDPFSRHDNGSLPPIFALSPPALPPRSLRPKDRSVSLLRCRLLRALLRVETHPAAQSFISLSTSKRDIATVHRRPRLRLETIYQQALLEPALSASTVIRLSCCTLGKRARLPAPMAGFSTTR